MHVISQVAKNEGVTVTYLSKQTALFRIAVQTETS